MHIKIITRNFQADNNQNKKKEDTGIITSQTHKNNSTDVMVLGEKRGYSNHKISNPLEHFYIYNGACRLE